jgi:hypothetical protein
MSGALQGFSQASALQAQVLGPLAEGGLKSAAD